MCSLPIQENRDVSFRMSYEVSFDQSAHGQAGRIVRLEMDCEPKSEVEIREAVSAFLTGVAGERETLFRLYEAATADD